MLTKHDCKKKLSNAFYLSLSMNLKSAIRKLHSGNTLPPLSPKYQKKYSLNWVHQRNAPGKANPINVYHKKIQSKGTVVSLFPVCVISFNSFAKTSSSNITSRADQ